MKAPDKRARPRPKLAHLRARLVVEVGLAIPEDHVVAMRPRQIRKNYTDALKELLATEAARSITEDPLELRLIIDGKDPLVVLQLGEVVKP